MRILAALLLLALAACGATPVLAQSADLPYNDGGVRRSTAPVYVIDPATGAAARPGSQPRLTPLGYCQLTTLSSSTQLSACAGGVPAAATIAQLCVEAQAVRYRDDGTAPTATVGMPASAGTCFSYSASLSALRVIQSTSGAILNVSFYR